MVAVDNSAARYEEYCGRLNRAHSVESTNASTNANTAFENYTAFLITELKPRIDREYRTKPDSANTGVMGSSMGGICSLVLAWEHLEVFGRGASLSGAFMVEGYEFSELGASPLPCEAQTRSCLPRLGHEGLYWRRRRLCADRTSGRGVAADRLGERLKPLCGRQAADHGGTGSERLAPRQVGGSAKEST